MEKYKNDALSVDERVADLISKMTLDEKIKQTDQFYTNDFTQRTPNGRIEKIQWDRLKESTQGMSVGSVQLRGASPKLANELQRYAVEHTRLGIPFLFSEEALHGLFDQYATCFPQQIGLAGTFEPELGRQMGRTIAAEARGLWWVIMLQTCFSQGSLRLHDFDGMWRRPDLRKPYQILGVARHN